MHLPILTLTEHYVVVAKPARLMVHRSKLCRDNVYALQLVRDQVGRYVHPIHRLDRATSGCLLFAFDPEWARLLQDALRDGQKTYLAMVRGNIEDFAPVDVRKPMKDDNGILKDAHTWAQALGGSADPRCSLVLARPSTGRYHQVRRHLRDLSHPVLMDATHGDTKCNRWWRENTSLSRLALHCWRMDLPLPDGRLQVTCPIPEDLGRVWREMPWWNRARATLDAL